MLTEEEISKAVEKVRQGLKAEGGDIEVVSLKDDILYIRLTGTCETCPMSGITLKNWVEKTLIEELKQIKAVKAV